jgi:hypothetical protein
MLTSLALIQTNGKPWYTQIQKATSVHSKILEDI